MPAPTRRGGRSRRAGPPDQIRATGTRHRRYVERRAPDPGPRAAWAFALVAIVVGVGFIVFIAFDGSGGRTGAVPTPTPSATGTAAVPIPSPTGALAVTGEGPGGPVPSAARTLGVPPTPSPTRPPAADRGGAGLRVEYPRDGEVVVSPRINAFGRADAGARVVRELPDGSLAEAVARPDGLWILRVDLEPGTTELRFRVDGVDDVPVVVRVTYQPR